MSMTQVTSGELVDSKIATIGYDQGIKFERASPGMFPHYRQGRWLYEEYGPRLGTRVFRWATDAEKVVDGPRLFESDEAYRSRLEAELRTAVSELMRFQ
jgi:hypothetical protein